MDRNGADPATSLDSPQTEARSLTASVVPPLIAFQLFNVAAAVSVFGPVLPLVATYLGATPAWLTALTSAGALAGLTQLAMAPWVERIGYRRTLQWAWTALLLPPLGILALIAVVGSLGGPGWWVPTLAALVLANGLLRTAAGVSWYPWIRTVIPNARLGRFLGLDMLATSLASFAAVTILGVYLGQDPGTGKFLRVVGFGVAGAAIATTIFRLIPRGATEAPGAENTPALSDVYRAGRRLLADPRYRRAALYIACHLGAFAPFGTLVFLIQKQQLGLAASTILYLHAAGQVTLALAARFWGSQVDRLGPARILLLAGAGLALVALLWVALGTAMPASVRIWACVLAAVGGLLQGGHAIAQMRLMLLVCPARAPSLAVALFQTISGITTMITPLLCSLLLFALPHFGISPQATILINLAAVGCLMLTSLLLLSARGGAETAV